jgi:sarcosine oxidase subunit beta
MHVVIIGGGIVGTALAAELGDRGMAVTLVERDELGGGTTAASAAVFTWQQTSPERDDHDLRERAWGTYQPLVEANEVSFEPVGMLSVAESVENAETLRGAVRPLREYGLDAEWIDTDGLREHGLDSSDVHGGLYTPEEGYFDPTELVQHFAARALESGVDIRTGTAVKDIEVQKGAVAGIITETDRLGADAVINAAGPWASAVNDMAGISVPLLHTFGPILVVEGVSHDLPFTLFESKRYLRPTGDRGAYVGKYLTDYADGETLDPDDPPAIDESFREEVTDLLATSVPALADGDVADEWVGLRTVTPDGRPIVGESPVEGYHLAVGMSGAGVTLAPAVADLLAASLAGDRQTALDRLAPNHFRGG